MIKVGDVVTVMLDIPGYRDIRDHLKVSDDGNLVLVEKGTVGKVVAVLDRARGRTENSSMCWVDFPEVELLLSVAKLEKVS